ncbi:hypothetical protein [Streptomyces zhihengii]|uniref:Uncharacterized protein n=1 Tax=Streptomyces zhihengii TaxID=1818004 RepID=A0ABS2UTW9_9ACTN|nr:hypothetical protein [Streptomyces zhihengii]MBM9620996.1 hypothetical protein [Streptomyces zhihengii]
MPDVVAYLVLAVLLAVACVVAVVAGLLLLAAWRWGQGAVALVVSERRTARLRAALVAELADPGQVYLPCHTPVCGHMHTVHHPDADGRMRCEHCDTPADIDQ